MMPSGVSMILMSIAIQAAAAPEAAPEAAVEAPDRSWVSLKIGVEMHALEAAAQDIAKSLAQLAQSVGKLADSPSLSEDDKAQLLAIIGRVDTLSGRVVAAIDRLPGAVQETREPLAELASDLQTKVIVTVLALLAAVLLVLGALLWGAYAFLFRPGRRLVSNANARLTNLVNSLERTAELIAQASHVEADTPPADPIATEVEST